MNTPTPEHTDLSADFIAETRCIAAEYERHVDTIEAHIHNHDIHRLWRTEVTAARVRHGLKADGGWYDTDYALDGIHYDMELGDDSLFFTGRADGDAHYFSIPLGFLSAETRGEALSELDARMASRGERARAEAAARDEKRRAHDEAEYERLRASLGKD